MIEILHESPLLILVQLNKVFVLITYRQNMRVFLFQFVEQLFVLVLQISILSLISSYFFSMRMQQFRQLRVGIFILGQGGILTLLQCS